MTFNWFKLHSRTRLTENIKNLTEYQSSLYTIKSNVFLSKQVVLHPLKLLSEMVPSNVLNEMAC